MRTPECCPHGCFGAHCARDDVAAVMTEKMELKERHEKLVTESDRRARMLATLKVATAARAVC